MNIQDVADGLATTLRRSVVISDRAHRPLASSKRDADAGGAHLVDLLRGPAQAATRSYLEQTGVVESRQTMRVTLSPFDDRERLAVPVRHADGPLATLWLSTGDLPREPDMITLYREPILVEWVETGEDLFRLVRNVIIHEVGHHFGFSDEEIARLEGEG